MRHAFLLLAVTAVACGAAQKPRSHATLAFRHVRVFDGEKVLPDAVVLVDGARIVALGSSVPIPPGVETIEGQGRTLLPGLIDAHAHIQGGGQLEQSLAFGVTTVLDMGMTAAFLAQLRAAGDSPARADLRSAGFMATAPGGHGTEYGIPIPTLTAAGEAQAWVDARLAEGSDYIKIILDGGAAYGRKTPTLAPDVIAALVAAAHARGKLAVAHIGTYEEARTALDAGVDGLVHIFRDRAPPPGFGTFVKAHGAFVAPTLAVLRSLHGKAGPLADDEAVVSYLSGDARAGLRTSFPIRAVGAEGFEAAAVAELRDAGVPILCGTDAPNPGTTYGATVHDELALLVAAGLTPTAALVAATAAPARAFGLPDRGRVAAGMRADLLLVDGDPTADITRTRAIAGIWRAGVRFDREAYRAALPAATPPARAGVHSTFDDGQADPWRPSTDALIGGASRVELKVEAGALSITGELVTGKAPAAWAGAMIFPGAKPMAPADLSAARGIRFRARGDGKTYTVMVFATRTGRAPTAQPFTAGAAFATVEIPWTAFKGLDGSDVTGILIGQATQAGPFALVIDDVEVR